MPSEPSIRLPPYPANLPSAGFALSTTFVVTIALAWPLGNLLGTTPLYAVKSAVLVPLLALLVAPVLDLRASIGPADLATLVRAVVTALVAGFLFEPLAGDFARLLWFGAGLAFMLDALDGWIARHTGTSSTFGARLDMELDGLTVFVVSALVWQLGHAGIWVFAAGLYRYLFIAAGWGLPWMNAELPPRARRAWMCGWHLTLTIFALLPWPQPFLAPLLAAVGLGGLTWSFAADVYWLATHRETA